MKKRRTKSDEIRYLKGILSDLGGHTMALRVSHCIKCEDCHKLLDLMWEKAFEGMKPASEREPTP
ncbi:hypothetical protein LCGC14_2993930 [marine sediment metagenome]|uniref:Uncharacterized protein n=1 Tax=marine sediment metagenome TaxID=412755 RepID=A0A0F8ZAJ4_9ZZZZ